MSTQKQEVADVFLRVFQQSQQFESRSEDKREIPMSFRITESCIGCELCAKQCPLGAIDIDKNGNFVIDIDECDECGECIKVCPVGAIVQEK